jgi:DNA-binding MarR family transcriptional regulator
MRHAFGVQKPSELVAAMRAGDAAPALAADITATALGLTQLSAAALRHIAAHSGCRNVEIAEEIGVAHESQMSRLLRRLADEGLVESRRDGRSHAWGLTERGAAVAARLAAGAD